MYANLDLPLTLKDIRAAPTHFLLEGVKKWLESDNPPCLLHPHGFYVVLLQRTEDEEWRFHFWPKGARFITGMPAFIHTHDRHVDSRILQGQLTNILYKFAPVSAGGQPLYEVGYGGDKYAAATSNVLRRTTARAEAVILERNTMGPGDAYHVDRHAYHEAIVPEQLATSTLVCMHGRSAGKVMVAGLDGYPEMIAFQRSERRARDFIAQLVNTTR